MIFLATLTDDEGKSQILSPFVSFREVPKMGRVACLQKKMKPFSQESIRGHCLSEVDELMLNVLRCHLTY